MKALQKPVATAAITAALLAAPAGLALASEAPVLPSTTLSHSITLKPSATVTVSDQLGSSTAKGLPWISGAYPFTDPIAASKKLTAADGTAWYQVQLSNCGVTARYFIPGSAVATDVVRPAGTLTAVNPANTSYAAQFKGQARLVPQAAIYLSPADTEPVFMTAPVEGIIVPATPTFTENGTTWRGIVMGGMTAAVVPASEVAAYTPTSCAPNAAVPAAVAPAVNTFTSHAFTVASANTPPAATETVAADAGGSWPQNVILGSGIAMLLAAAVGVTVSAINGKKAKR